MQKHHLLKMMLLGALTSAILLSSACKKAENSVSKKPVANTPSLEQPTANKPLLTVITYQQSDNLATDSMDLNLVTGFAEQSGYQLNVILAEKEEDIFQALAQGHAQLGLVNGPISKQQEQQFLQTQAYMDVTAQLIYKHGSGRPKTFADMDNKNIVVKNRKHYQDKYAFLKKQHPDIKWTFSDDSTDALLEKVNRGDIDYAILSSHEYLKHSPKFPRTRIAFDIYYPEPIGFSVANTEIELNEQLNDFIDASLDDGTIEHLSERFLGHIDDVDPRGSLTFFRRVNYRLPNYIEVMERVAKKYNMDWRLLAAIAYQESHWNPNARSHTGVRGMMMLTQQTAEFIGVENRLDLIQSLEGGARYYKSLYRRLPKSIEEPDRSWFALAAYNVGLGHIYDARKITEFQDGNADRWADVQLHLPLLEDKSWYRYTRYGKARGSEPVAYVQNIRHFYDLLEWRFPKKENEILRDNSHIEVSIKNFDDVLKEAKTKTEKTQQAVSQR